MAESRFWEGFVIGGLVGLAAGLLFAPQSGAETRRVALEKGREVKTAAGEAARGAARKVASQVQEAAATLREAVGRGREVAVEVTTQLNEQMDNGEAGVEG